MLLFLIVILLFSLILILLVHCKLSLGFVLFSMPDVRKEQTLLGLAL